MILRVFAAVLLTVGLIITACTASFAGSGDVAAGKEVYLKKCKTCHGEDGHGNPGMAKLLKTTITPLDSEEVQSKSDADIKKIITEGKDKMKPVKDLTDADISNVITYVRSLKK